LLLILVWFKAYRLVTVVVSATASASVSAATAATTSASVSAATTAATTTITAAAVATVAIATTAIATSVSTATTTAATTITTATTTAAATLFTRLGFVDSQGATTEHGTIELGDCCFRFIIIAHFDKAKATGLTGELIFDHCGIGDITNFAEKFRQLFGCGAIRQTTHIDTHNYTALPKSPKQSPTAAPIATVVHLAVTESQLKE
jgi:hypothetical protein